MSGEGQLAYWATVGAGKTFTHPVRLRWLDGVDRGHRVLDYGCGYGRVAAELADHGFGDVVGVDPSPALVARARPLRSDVRFEVLERPPTLPDDLGRFGVALLVAVLTCVVDDDAQRALVDVVIDALEPGGLLYLSDVLLQDDERSRSRYAAAPGDLPYGAFVTDDGAVCRHHDPTHLRGLLGRLRLVEEREVDVVTMNGNRSRAVQMLLRRPGPGGPGPR